MIHTPVEPLWFSGFAQTLVLLAFVTVALLSGFAIYMGLKRS